MATSNTLKLIQSRLRNKGITASYNDIRESASYSQYSDQEELAEEQVQEIVKSFLPEIEVSSSITIQTTEPKTMTYVKEESPIESQKEIQVHAQAEEQTPKGELQLVGQEKLDFVENTAKRSGLVLAKAEIAEIAEKAPSSFATRRQMIGSILQEIKNYLAEEEEFFGGEIHSLQQTLQNTDRNVANLISEVGRSAGQSATDFKSVGEGLAKAFKGIKGGNYSSESSKESDKS